MPLVGRIAQALTWAGRCCPAEAALSLCWNNGLLSSLVSAFKLAGE